MALPTDPAERHRAVAATPFGQDERLDPQTCADLLAGMEPIEELLRTSGQYGPRVVVPDDADVQTRMLAFIGRHP